MNDIKQFEIDRKKRIESYSSNKTLQKASKEFMEETIRNGYSYNFSWLGLPIIQYPQDMIAIQEIIWKVKPDLIVETGIARGGSLIFYSSLIEVLGGGKVVGIDIDIRDHNRREIENHPCFKNIEMIEGSSVSDDVINKVKKIVNEHNKIMVILDSNHSHEHVFKEIEAYSKYVSKGSYLIVLDTVVEDLESDEIYQNRPWGKGDNPKTAVHEFLSNNDSFEIDQEINNKLLISVGPDGFLKRVKL